MNEYEEFCEKFKPKKTTDDCYTPDAIYAVIADYVASEYNLSRSSFVRPFYPGGDYENYDYSDGAVVVDNPPFSIFTKILKFYQSRHIPFFLFCNALTSLGAVAGVKGVTLIAPGGKGSQMIYENGARVLTYFATNLEPENIVRVDLRLGEMLENVLGNKKSLSKYNYPDAILTIKYILRLAANKVPYTLKANEAIKVPNIDALRELKSCCFGGALMLSEKAEKEKPFIYEREEYAFVLKLSEREKETQKEIGKNEN